MTIPDCHPDRRHHGRGLCVECYRAQAKAAYADVHGTFASRRAAVCDAVVAALDTLHANPDRPLGRCACIKMVAEAVGCSAETVRRALKLAGRDVVPRQRRQVPCVRCGRMRTEARAYDAPGAGQCRACWAIRRGKP